MEICLVYGSFWRFVTQFSQSVILTWSGQTPNCGDGGRRGAEVEDAVLLRYNTVSLGRKFHKFRIIIVALSWKVWAVRRSNSWHNDATLNAPRERRPRAVSGSVYKSKSMTVRHSPRLPSFHRLYILHMATERQTFTRRCGGTRSLHLQNFYRGRVGVTWLATYVTSDLG
jgi:hypothetical protein